MSMITIVSPSNKIRYDISIDKDRSTLLDFKEIAMSVQTNPRNIIYISVEKLNDTFHKPLLNILAKHIYTFDKYKTNSKTPRGKQVYFVTNGTKDTYKKHLEKIVYGNIARNLANEPANIIYPQSFCDKVRYMFNKVQGARIRVFNEKDLRKKNMSLLNAVGKGSIHPPRMLIVELLATKTDNTKNVVLVGKGITFDTGGYNLKPDNAMEGMHGDKAGGCIVVAALKYLSSKPHRQNNYYGVIPLAENMVSGNAYKVGDVFKAYNGKTVEIGDTDKEGRIALADALSYACEQFKPDLLIDVATLTGWASKLHCDISFNYFTLNEVLASKLHKLQSKTGERSIRLPPWLEYRKFTRSNVADYTTFDSKECGGNEGFMAAMFLSNFIDDEYIKNWVHIDIAHDTTNQYMNANSIYTVLELLDIEE
jgi:leucyl aminopeptidase